MSKKWYPPYKCQYCQAKLYNKDYLYKTHRRVRDRNNALKIDKILDFKCPDCRARFEYSVLTGKTIVSKFFFGPNDKYNSVINYQSSTFEVLQVIQSKYGFHTEQLIKLDHIPRNWNPETAPEKLKLYLLFS